MDRPYIEQFVSRQDSTPKALIEGTMHVLEYERAKGKLPASTQPSRLSPDGKFLYLAPFWACRDDGASFLEGPGPESRNFLPVRIYHEAQFNLFNPAYHLENTEIARHHVPQTRDLGSGTKKPKEPKTLFGLVNLYHNTLQRLDDRSLHSRNPDEYRTLKQSHTHIGDSLISRILNKHYQR